jgi:predicted dehydrogenase
LEVSINVNAENGNLSVTDDFVKLFLDQKVDGYASGWTNFSKPDLFQGVEIDLGGPQYTRQDADFVAAVERRTKVASDIKNAYETQKIVDAIYQSAAKHGAPVRL